MVRQRQDGPKQHSPRPNTLPRRAHSRKKVSARLHSRHAPHRAGKQRSHGPPDMPGHATAPVVVTDGQVTTQFLPDNQSGQEADMVNQVKLGVIDMTLIGAPIWANIVPEFGVFDLGYVFTDYDHLRRAAAAPAGQAPLQSLVQKAGTRTTASS